MKSIDRVVGFVDLPSSDFGLLPNLALQPLKFFSVRSFSTFKAKASKREGQDETTSLHPGCHLISEATDFHKCIGFVLRPVSSKPVEGKRPTSPVKLWV